MIRELKSLDPEIRDRSGLSALHVAATMPHSSALRAMLDVFYGQQVRSSHERRRYDVDHATTAGDSALHVSCLEGDADKVRMMLRRGADLERRGSNSYTLLHRLVQVRLVRFLVRAHSGKRQTYTNFLTAECRLAELTFNVPLNTQ